MTGIQIGLLVIGLLAVCYGALCAVLLCVALLRCSHPEPDPEQLRRLQGYGHIVREGVAWLKSQALEEVEITSFDGLRLRGWFLPAENARCTAILMHGYRSEYLWDFAGVYRLLHEYGCNLLVPYERAQGRSQGRFITMGVREKRDCADWARYIRERLGGELPIVLQGMSMGATTVMLAAGEPLPENVKGIVADCGYTTPWAEFAHVLYSRTRLQAHPILDGVELLSRIFAGFGFRDTSTLEALGKSRLPLLLIHGEADHFVPTRFSRENYAASASPDKTLLLVPDAAHGCSFLVEPERCRQALEAFYDRVTASRTGN